MIQSEVFLVLANLEFLYHFSNILKILKEGIKKYNMLHKIPSLIQYIKLQKTSLSGEAEVLLFG
jgi:hypothetical protein